MTMAKKFRKKPIVVEAVKVFDLLYNTTESPPIWISNAIFAGIFTIHQEQGRVAVSTLEGVMDGDTDDWIIMGLQGELYPCKPDIFAATYEEVES